MNNTYQLRVCYGLNTHPYYPIIPYFTSIFLLIRFFIFTNLFVFIKFATFTFTNNELKDERYLLYWPFNVG